MHCISTQDKNLTPQSKRLSFVYFIFLFLFSFFFLGGGDLFLSRHQSSTTHCHHLMQFNSSWISSFDQESNNSTSWWERARGHFLAMSALQGISGREEGKEGGGKPAHMRATSIRLAPSYAIFISLQEPYEAGAMLQVRTARLSLGSYLGWYAPARGYGTRDWHGICEPNTLNPGWGKEEKQEGVRDMRKPYPWVFPSRMALKREPNTSWCDVLMVCKVRYTLLPKVFLPLKRVNDSN